MQTSHTHNPGRWRRVLAGALVAILVFAGCGDDEPTGADNPGAAGLAPGSTPAEPIPDSAPDTGVVSAPDTSVVSAPDTSVVSTPAAEDADSSLPLVDAVVVDTIELPRSDLGFLFSDGEALWATGDDGAIVRIDPDSGDVEELTIGDGLISGQLLPAATDDEIWFSAIQGSHIVRLDPSTLTSDPPIEVPGAVGLVLVGPGEQMWMAVTGPPAGLLPVDPQSGTYGDVLPIDTDGEAIGAAVAFDSMWVPLFEDRTILRLDETGAVADRVPSGVGPAYIREAHGMLWHPNLTDGTISRIDPDGLDVATIDLNIAGDAIAQPSATAATSDAIWLRAGRLSDRAAIVFRIDPDTADVVGRRTLPGGRRLDQVGGLATLDDRLFVLDRPGRVLLELDVDQFVADDATQVTVADETISPDELAVRDALRTLLSTATTPDDMQLALLDGERLTDQIRAFKQYFEDNLPGELYEGEVLSVRLDGDQADIEFFVTVAGAPIVEPIQGTMVREDGRWLLTAVSFCRLVATGGITCPADVAVD